MKKPKLLIVEDEPAIRRLIELQMQAAGYEAVTAGDGLEALAVLRHTACQLVISDIRMPDMDGLALLAALQQQANRRAQAPVGTILLTGCNDLSLAVQAMQLGALDYVLKPFDPGSLESSVRTALERCQKMVEAWQEERRREELIQLQQHEMARMSHQLTRAADSGREQRQSPSLREALSDGSPSSRSAGQPPSTDKGLAAEILSRQGGTPRRAYICSADYGMFRVATDISFERGARVVIRFRNCSVEGEVNYCLHRDEVFFLGVCFADGQDSRRREPRFPLHWPGRLIRLGSEECQETPVVVLDVSPSGMGLRCPRELPAGDFLAVEMETATAFGEVIYCRRMPDQSFRVGIALKNVISAEPPSAPGTAGERKVSWLGKLLATR